VAGLDLAKALKGLHGKWGLLQKLLDGFRSDFAGTAGEIRALLDAGELEQAAGRLHTLKGVAGMLGAPRLYQAAQHLELEIRSAGQVPAGWLEFQNAMEELLKGIADALLPEPMPAPGDADHGQDHRC
jgi:HPt (histidine-containing phosphotransfer) domain-containing protein